MRAPAVFDGLCVIDLTHGYAGALATMALADNGAQVTRIEPPERCGYRGDPSQRAPGRPQWHRSKSVLRANLKQAAGRDRVRELVNDADILVTAFRPGVLERLGLGWNSVSARNPRLIYCSITGFGPIERLRAVPGYEAVVCAAAGWMNDLAAVREADRPIFPAIPVAGFGAAQAAVQGICAALHVRHRTGRGQRVEASLLQGLTAYDLNGWLRVQQRERNPEGHFPGSYAEWVRRPPIQYVPARTSDGAWIQFANWAPHLFWAQAEMLDLGYLRNDPEFAGLPMKGSEEVKIRYWEAVLEATARRSAGEWMELLTRSGQVGGDVVRSAEEGMDHPQARHNGDVISVDDPLLGASEQIGPLLRFSVTPSRIGQASSAPALPDTSSATAAEQSPATDAGPLAGITVIEAAAMYAAPFGATLLADLGARVIKVEPIGGDPYHGDGSGKTLQGKESIEVDLKQREGQEIMHRLVARADLFMHNYRPGIPEKLGIDYQTLRRVNGRIVYLYAGAYGDKGPYSSMPAYHTIPGAVCGIARRQAGAGGVPPPDAKLTFEELKATSLRLWHSNEGNPDPNAALVVATAMLMGLIARDRHGCGQEMLTTMLCASAYVMSDEWIRYPGKPEGRETDAQLLGYGPLYRLYPTAAGWVFLACLNHREWASFAQAAGNGLHEDTRFATRQARAAHAQSLGERLEKIFLQATADEWEEKLLKAGVACVRADRAPFPHFLHREPAARASGLIVDVQDPSQGKIWRHGPMVQLSGGRASQRPGAPVGSHTRAVLEEIGYDRESMENLARRGVTALR